MGCLGTNVIVPRLPLHALMLARVIGEFFLMAAKEEFPVVLKFSSRTVWSWDSVLFWA